jgi:hypothetical protein
MKKWMLVLLPIALLIPKIARAQDLPKADDGKKPALTTASVPTKAKTIAGQVSDDGRTLVSDDDDIWAVSNPSVLAKHVGQQVRIKCQILPGKSEIHMFSVKVDPGEVRYVSSHGDSAFRR